MGASRVLAANSLAASGSHGSMPHLSVDPGIEMSVMSIAVATVRVFWPQNRRRRV
jgi:hypothetical protein